MSARSGSLHTVLLGCALAWGSGAALAGDANHRSRPTAGEAIVQLEAKALHELSMVQRLELADAYVRQARVEEAESVLGTLARRGEPTTKERLVRGDIARHRGAWEEAEAQFRAAAADSDARADVYLRWGQALHELGRVVEADQVFARYLELSEGGARP